jgi:VWFA-related protein
MMSVAAARANDAAWEHLDSVALARAKAEQKIVLLYVRASCATCNQKLDALVADNDPELVRALTGFVLLRLHRKDDAEAVNRLLTNREKFPGIFFLDPDGGKLEQPGQLIVSRTGSYSPPPAGGGISTTKNRGAVASTVVTPSTTTLRTTVLRDLTRPDQLLMALQLMQGASPLFVAASRLRAENKVGDAEAAIGNAYLQARNAAAAVTHFQRAQEAFGTQGDSAGATISEANLGLARFVSGEKGRGIASIDHALRSAPTPSVTAAVWLSMAQLRELDNDRAAAIAAYRKSYAAAPAHSDIAAAAADALLQFDSEPLIPKEPPPAGTLQLILPRRFGKTIEVAAVGEGIARVDYFVDDQPAGTATAPPFRATLTLGGDDVRMHTIKAIGNRANGSVAATAIGTVNDRVDAFHVAITAPVTDTVSGAATIEAAVVAPPNRSVRSVELFWEKEKIGSFTAAPFRVEYPVNGKFGFLRAVATLDDGTTSEDSKLINAGGVERVDVQGASFLATIQDRNGARIGGLTSRDVVVDEDGHAVDAAVRETLDEPATIGIAIDASSSMRTIMPAVADIARRLLERGLSPGDRVFLVTFAMNAELRVAATDDRDAIRKSLADVTASGGTSIFDGIAFGLRQFQAIPGKKALIVITDGSEGESSTSAATTARIAKEMAIPIYGFIPPGANRHAWDAMKRLAVDTGGLFFVKPDAEAMEGIVAKLRDEIRGQYQISFSSPRRGVPGTWRALRVSVPQHRGAVVRTISGYWIR